MKILTFLKPKTKMLQVFVPFGSSFRVLKEVPQGLSINDVSKYLGYLPAQTHSFFGGLDSNSDISTIVFEVFTSNIIFILAKADSSTLDEKVVKDLMRGFDEKTEYGIANVVDILQDGITAKTFSIEFLKKVLGIEPESGDCEFFVQKLDITLHFQGGYLKDFSVPFGLGKWARYVKEINPDLFSFYSKESKRFRGDDLDGIIVEMNAQFDAWASIPDAFGNEFIDLHRNKSGTINFFMLAVCHYDHQISRIEFEEINKGRYKRLTTTETGETLYALGNFTYLFGLGGELIRSDKVNTDSN